MFANHTLQWSDAQLIDLAAKVGGASPSEAFKTCVTSKAHADWVSSINARRGQERRRSDPDHADQWEAGDIATLTPDALKAMITSASQR